MEEKTMSNERPFPKISGPRISEHARLRYAERILGRKLSYRRLLSDPKLHGRVRRGILRLLEGATEVGLDGDAAIFVNRSRALVIKNDCIVTVLASGTTGGFSKKKRRSWGLIGLGSLSAADCIKALAA